MQNLIPVAAAAEEFHVHRATLYRYVKAGRLIGYERGIGRGVYVDREELRKLAEFRPVDGEAKQ